jgi:hypothetical protein
MAEDAKDIARTIGRGRPESTPWYVHNATLLVVGTFAAIVIAIALIAFYVTR